MICWGVEFDSLTVITITKNTYDALGRLTETVNNMIDYATGVSSGEKVIVQNSYDDVGQLKTKRLGVNGTTAVETQKYDYNVRGWLLGVNRDYVNNTQSTSKFGFELSYDKPASMNPTNAPLYNGNIATMTWRGNQNGADIRRYDFAYDNTSRLLKADFKALTGTVQSGTFNSQMGDGINPESAYDYNGNILAMTQQGLYGGASTTIDQLTYTYIPGTNKLQKVTDGQTANLNLGDFYNGNTGDNIDYSYDDNGNLKQDLNKNITDIGYNYLNLPENISVAGKGSIVYSYDGVGNKLTKTVNETGQPQKVTVYLGNLIFENNALQFVNTEEGRARLESGAWKYDYFLKDHLGNVRMMLDDNGNVLEETHYYPFGLQQKGISWLNTSVAANKYKFNGIEQTTDLYLNQYDADNRTLDPQLGRWWQVDPRASDWESPFVAMANNPVLNIDPLGDTIINGQTYENFSRGETLANVTVVGHIKSGSSTNFWGKAGRSVQGVYNNYLEPSMDWMNREINPLVPVAELISGRSYSSNFTEPKSRLESGQETLMAIFPVGRLGKLGAFGKLAAKGGVQYTKSSLKLGQEMHKAYNAGKVGKEFRLLSGKRIDYLDIQNGIIYELKPFNPRAMKAGQNQLNMYLKELQSPAMLQKYPEFRGINWKSVLDTY